MNPPRDDLEPVKILLVDDRPSNLTSLEAILRRPEYDVILARSGNEALAYVLRSDFAVILLDVAMPEMDGFEIATIIKQREESKLIPIIFVTASVYDLEHIFRGYTVGAVDYLRKPIDSHQVRAKVAVFVELFRQRKQIERQALWLREAELREQRLLRERAEAALRESEALYAHTFEEAPIGIGYASPEGRWLHANARLCQILGRSRAELVGASVEDIADDGETQELVDALSRMEDGRASSYAREHQLAGGRARDAWGVVSISALRDPAGRLARLIVVIDDTSARKRAELERASLIQKLERSIRLRDEFLDVTAHELKTPITPLRLQTASLLRAGEQEAEAGTASARLLRRLHSIDLAAQRMEELIDRLLDVTRLSIGKLTLQLEDVDATDVIADVVSHLEEEAQRAGSTISVHAPESAVGRWDRVHLEQVVTNLVVNAIKYGNGKPIDISVAVEGDHCRLSVKDRGIGIPPSEQERIFQRFETLTPVQHARGFGVGLWLVRAIVEAHGGRVTLSSRPGQGSEFMVELPMRPAHGTREAGDEVHP